MKSTKSALLVGASGLVGSNCLHLLLEDDYYSRVVAIVRSKLWHKHTKLEQYVADFDRLEDYQGAFRVNDVFCCLGTTIRKAGSQEEFHHVDFGYAYRIAQLASLGGADQFALISALGADRMSSVFYNRVKGEVESAIQEIKFKALQIFRPSLLIGNRQEFRAGERIGIVFFHGLRYLLWGPFKKYRPIEAKVLALAMIQKIKENQGGTHIYESNAIQAVYDKEVERLITRKLN